MLNIISARFVKASVEPEHFPPHRFPEFAFFGRSNVGKSSLIKMLLNRKKLVKTGSTPGMTKTINFFAVNEANPNLAFFLADLPGYGYAKTSAYMRAKIDKMLYDYCMSREQLKIMFFLTDIRRPPSSVEKDITDFFYANAIPFEIVATKIDKASQSEQFIAKNELAEFYGVSSEKIILTSTLKNTGRAKLLSLIQQNLGHN